MRPLRLTLPALALLAAAIAGCGAPAPASRAPLLIRVDAAGHGDVRDLSTAVARAPAGATISLAAGTYRLARPLDVFRSLTLVGAGPGRTIVLSSAPGHALGFAGNGSLAARGITVRHVGAAAADVVLSLGGRLDLRVCSFEGGSGQPRRGGGGAGLAAFGPTTGSVDGCRAAGNAGPAVALADTATLRVTRLAAAGPAGRRVVRLVQPGPTDPRELARFFDQLVLRLMAERHIPGVAVVVVRAGRPFLARGWGYADVASGRSMDPLHTRLRVASLSKIVTATAVMQLVERGRLALDDDVNDFLSRPGLPPAYSQPVTLGALLTQSGGLDDAVSGTAARTVRAAVPLTTYLRDDPPQRIAPPGLIFSYSNKNLGLAGAAVERAAGEPFAAYARQAILDPLGMTETTFTPPSRPGRDWALGYRYQDDAFVARPFDYLNDVPAVGMVSTGRDMGRLMLAELGGGRLGGARILGPAAARAMLTRQFAEHPALPGTTYGFQELFRNGRRLVRHNGDWGGFSSAVFLMPREGIGVFVCDNGGETTLREELIADFLDRYYPARGQLAGPPAPPGFGRLAGRFTGTYRATRYDHATFEKLFTFNRGSETRVSAEGDELAIDGERYAQVEPLLFRSRAGDQIAFAARPDGAAAYLFQGVSAAERLHWYQTFTFGRRLLTVVVALFVLALVVWPGGALRRRLLRRPPLWGSAS
ncbi:MAG TPA: serine hydrolase domain-containing protein [Thermoleophilia bacterium]|nr:serine hydrolase domain-containing protein [Thermoleophilia bacterium]